MSDILKPCPFCGHPVEVREPYTQAHCVTSDCVGRWSTVPSAEGGNIYHWNTRPIEDALRAQIAEYEEVLNSVLFGIISSDYKSEAIRAVLDKWKAEK